MARLLGEWDSDDVVEMVWDGDTKSWLGPIALFLQKILYAENMRSNSRYILRADKVTWKGTEEYAYCDSLESVAQKVMDGQCFGSTRLYSTRDGIYFISSGHDIPTGSRIEVGVSTRFMTCLCNPNDPRSLAQQFMRIPKLKCRQKFWKETENCNTLKIGNGTVTST